jgi:hypothetical protein
MQRRFGRSLALVAALGTALLCWQTFAFAQYQVHSLISNQVGKGPNLDRNLVNAWGSSSAAQLIVLYGRSG